MKKKFIVRLVRHLRKTRDNLGRTENGNSKDLSTGLS